MRRLEVDPWSLVVLVVCGIWLGALGGLAAAAGASVLLVVGILWRMMRAPRTEKKPEAKREPADREA